MSKNSLFAISPLDGRYADKIDYLSNFFSEAALIRYRCHVEVEYLIALAETGIMPDGQKLVDNKDSLRQIVLSFQESDAVHVKEIESGINHDVKAIEYFIREKLAALGLNQYEEWVHFGLTSQDINNAAFPLMIREAAQQHIFPLLDSVIDGVLHFARQTKSIPMLAHTHGQPASPTILGKEMMVFVERLNIQAKQFEETELKIKFGGATGNFNAHAAAFPKVQWNSWADTFAENYLAIKRYHYTTQIEHYDQLAAWCHALLRVNTILIDFCRDVWTYISMGYLMQKANPKEVGSSAMPHKVNPIDFENAEGNLAFANAMFGFLAEKLPVSRLQRDLTDSTVLRNIGVPVGHTCIALHAVLKGLSKIAPNEQKMQNDLEENWAVLAEAIQTILRREGVSHPYELLKELTRGKAKITREELHQFIDKLDIRSAVKEELKQWTPSMYTGIDFNPD